MVSMMRLMAIVLWALGGIGVPAHANPIDVAIETVNEFRSQSALPVLVPSPTLNDIASAHAADMMRNGFVSHKGSDGSQLSNRVSDAGYQFCFVAQNIEAHAASFEDALKKWDAYPPTRKILLHRKAREIGIAHVGDGIWVMVLARPGCDYMASL